jgi:hypothetical protein
LRIRTVDGESAGPSGGTHRRFCFEAEQVAGSPVAEPQGVPFKHPFKKDLMDKSIYEARWLLAPIVGLWIMMAVVGVALS